MSFAHLSPSKGRVDGSNNEKSSLEKAGDDSSGLHSNSAIQLLLPNPGSGSSINAIEGYREGSAPPPPGFSAAPDQRAYTPRFGGVSSATAQYSGTQILMQRSQLNQDINYCHQQPSSLLQRSDLPNANDEMGDLESDKKRTKSFANLAAALGEGLAESMNDSFLDERERRLQHERTAAFAASPGVSSSVRSSLSQAASALRDTNKDFSTPSTANLNGTASFSSAQQGGIDNFARQSRHAASRLIGFSTGLGSDLRLSSSPNRDFLSSNFTSGCLNPASSQQQPIQSHASPYLSSLQQTLQDSSFGIFGNASPEDVSRCGNIGIGVTVVEPPSSSSSPAPQIFAGLRSGTSYANSDYIFADEARRLLQIKNTEGPAIVSGRASAPPQMFDPQFRDRGLSSTAMQSHMGSSLQKRAAELLDLKHQAAQQRTSEGLSLMIPSSRTPEPSLANSASTYANHRQLNALHNPATDSTLENEKDRRTERELSQYCWNADEQSQTSFPLSSASVQPTLSRGLAILRASRLNIADVRSTCEAFGPLLYLRPEFCHSHGVIFVAYHDLRNSRHAALELESHLRRLVLPLHGNVLSVHSRDDVIVKYCVSLTSSSAIDDSLIRVSELPGNINERDLHNLMTSYGAVRSVHYRTDEAESGGGPSYTVEFYDIQDARQALLEIESTLPWGPGVLIGVGDRNLTDRKRGQDLLTLVGRWRTDGHSNNRSDVGASTRNDNNNGCLSSSIALLDPGKSSIGTTQAGVRNDFHSRPSPSPLVSSTSSSPRPNQSESFPRAGGGSLVQGNSDASLHPQSAHLVLGPDGQYSYVMVNHPSQLIAPPQYGQQVQHQAMRTFIPPPQNSQQLIVHGQNGAYLSSVPSHGSAYSDPHQYWVHHSNSVPQQFHHIPGTTIISATPFVDSRHGPPVQMFSPGFPATASVCTDSSVSGSSSGQRGRHASKIGSEANSSRRTDGAMSNAVPNQANAGSTPVVGFDEDACHLSLDIDAVRNGKDTRTSLMVRNIPNKYTQRMLLSEFAEFGHGSDKIDFFYLPIDFKNKCNRGYAFVNFVDYRDIVAFHVRYNGNHWKVFNSDKICDITYARIQGKAGMLKRFQNSALMEKDDEYRPLVFVSHGVEKGHREEFPTSA